MILMYQINEEMKVLKTTQGAKELAYWELA